MIDNLDDEVKTYLTATGAVAIYVATVDGVPVRVGFSHDPHKTRAFLAKRWPGLAIAWLAWFEESNASGFVASITANVMELVIQRRNDGVTVPRPLPVVIGHIEHIARLHGATLTPHERAHERARQCLLRLDQALTSLQANGNLGAFNHAYKVYREGQRARGESAMPYWAVRQELKRVVIRYLVAHDELAPELLLDEIRQRFPWFHAKRPLEQSARPNRPT